MVFFQRNNYLDGRMTQIFFMLNNGHSCTEICVNNYSCSSFCSNIFIKRVFHFIVFVPLLKQLQIPHTDSTLYLQEHFTLARALMSGSLSCIRPAVSTSTTSIFWSRAKLMASIAIPAASLPGQQISIHL